MVAGGEQEVVNMAADEAGGEAAEVGQVFDPAEGVLAGGMAKVMPVAKDVGEGGEVVKDGVPEVVEGDFFGGFAAFEAEADVVLAGEGGEVEEGIADPGPAAVEGGLVGGEGADLMSAKRAVAPASAGEEGFELRSNWTLAGRAEVKNDAVGTDFGGAKDGLAGVFERVAAAGGAGVGELKAVGVGAGEAHGQRAEVVEGGDADASGTEAGEDAGPEAKADAVAEFDVGES